MPNVGTHVVFSELLNAALKIVGPQKSNWNSKELIALLEDVLANVKTGTDVEGLIAGMNQDALSAEDDVTEFSADFLPCVQDYVDDAQQLITVLVSEALLLAGRDDPVDAILTRLDEAVLPISEQSGFEEQLSRVHTQVEYAQGSTKETVHVLLKEVKRINAVNEKIIQMLMRIEAAVEEDNRISTRQLLLALGAAVGIAEMSAAVAQIAGTIIKNKNTQLCKDACFSQRYQHVCTVDYRWGRKSEDGFPLCEWGNDSFLWLITDLIGQKSLLRFESRDGAGLENYFVKIINSNPLKQRWRDWRFGNNIHVPTYIQSLDVDVENPEKVACAVFRGLCTGELIANLAQKLGEPEALVKVLADRICIKLVEKNRLHLLQRPKVESLSIYESGEDGEDDYQQREIADKIYDLEYEETVPRMEHCWQKLSSVEQFVLEAMDLDGVDAKVVLQALERENITLPTKKDAVTESQKLNQLYYFRKKTYLKLAACVKGRGD